MKQKKSVKGVKKQDRQTISSINNYTVPVEEQDAYPHDFKKKYQVDASITNRYASWMSNPTVQPDGKTEMGVPIPSEENVEYSKEYGEDHEM